jgi:hypothetical protein
MSEQGGCFVGAAGPSYHPLSCHGPRMHEHGPLHLRMSWPTIGGASIMCVGLGKSLKSVTLVLQWLTQPFDEELDLMRLG